jgi:hypothetical protein
MFVTRPVLTERATHTHTHLRIPFNGYTAFPAYDARNCASVRYVHINTLWTTTIKTTKSKPFKAYR